MAYSPDGKRFVSISGVGNESLIVWETASGKIIKTTSNLSLTFAEINFSADSKKIAVNGYEHIHIFEADTGTLISSFNIRSIALIPEIYQPKPDSKVKPEFYANAVALDRTGELLAVTGSIKEGENFAETDPSLTIVFNMKTQTIISSAQAEGYVAKFMPDGKTLVLGDDIGLIVWNYDAEETPPQIVAEHRGQIVRIYLDEAGRTLTIVDSKLNIRKFDVATWKDAGATCRSEMSSFIPKSFRRLSNRTRPDSRLN